MAMKVSKAVLPRWVRDFVEGQGYRGRGFAVEARERYEIPSDAGLWDGGTCEKFYALTKQGATAGAMNNRAPWTECGRGQVVEIPEGVVLVRRAWFCGKDCGFTFYVRPPHGTGDLLLDAAARASLQPQS